jgi:sugar/nucleoside kinase (ribokinase family)
MKYDLLSIGDPTIDTFLVIHDANVNCTIDKHVCQLCVNYADKIPVNQFFRFPAGNMPNNAIGASRLGLKVAVYGMVGNDDDGKWLMRELENEGVEARYLKVDPKRGTNSSTVVVFRAERTIFVWHERRQYQLPALPAAEWVYLTSMGPLESNLESFHRQVLGYLKSHPAKLAFNPGTFQLLMGAEALAPFLKRAEITILNKEETEELTKKETKDIKVLLRALKELGSKIVVVTDGTKGSFAYDGETYWAVGIYDLPVVERTGAGDSYATGFVAARHYGLSIPEAMRWGTFNAAHVVNKLGTTGKFGGIMGLLPKAELEKVCREHPELKVREI